MAFSIKKGDQSYFEIVKYPILNEDVSPFPSHGVYKLDKSENATLQLSMICEKVLDLKYLLKLNNASQTSSERFVETPPICLV